MEKFSARQRIHSDMQKPVWQGGSLIYVRYEIKLGEECDLVQVKFKHTIYVHTPVHINYIYDNTKLPNYT